MMSGLKKQKKLKKCSLIILATIIFISIVGILNKKDVEVGIKVGVTEGIPSIIMDGIKEIYNYNLDIENISPYTFQDC